MAVQTSTSGASLTLGCIVSAYLKQMTLLAHSGHWQALTQLSSHM
jgi:hypothetical protein